MAILRSLTIAYGGYDWRSASLGEYPHLGLPPLDPPKGLSLKELQEIGG